MPSRPVRATRRAALAALPALVLGARAAARAQTPASIRVVGPPNDGFRAAFYGVRAGIFRRYGLDVQTIVLNNGAAAAAALIGGSAEVAYTNIVTVIQAYRRGIPIRVLSPATLFSSDRPSSSGMLVLKDSPVKSGRDLTGKVLGTLALGDLNAVASLAWVDQTGGDSKAVKLIEVPPSAAVAFLEDARADAVTTIEPGVSQALASGKVRLLTRPFDAIAKRFQGGAYAVLTPETDKNPDAMTRFARGLREAQLYTNSHLAETVDLVASYSGASPNVIARSVRMIDPEFVDTRDIQPVIDVLAKYGQLDRAFPAEEIVSSAALRPGR
jgi:NitT/TauT family transport system substrate-binding protein